LGLGIGRHRLSPAAALCHPHSIALQALQLLSGARGWGTLAQLQPVLARWVAAQAAGFNVWVARQVEKEDWRPLGESQVRARGGGPGGTAFGG
jgi:hypothetical protein